MSGVSLPVTRPIGRVLIVGGPACRSGPLATLQRHGFNCAELEDPYTAMAELCRRPLVYRALILSLQSLFREELGLIGSVKRRFPHLEVWLTHTDGRQAAMAEAMRQGADGLLADDGLHRVGLGIPGIEQRSPASNEPANRPAGAKAPAPSPVSERELDHSDENPMGETVLTADELRALLQEQPTIPPSGNAD